MKTYEVVVVKTTTYMVEVDDDQTCDGDPITDIDIETMNWKLEEVAKKNTWEMEWAVYKNQDAKVTRVNPDDVHSRATKNSKGLLPFNHSHECSIEISEIVPLPY